MNIPDHIQIAFICFVEGGGYTKDKVCKEFVRFVKPSKDALIIFKDGAMNDAMAKHWNLFCRIWLQKGRTFIESFPVTQKAQQLKKVA